MQTLCTLSQCEILKEKGFDWEVRQCFSKYATGDCTLYLSQAFKNYNIFTYVISRPDLNTAADWLRSKGIHIRVQPVLDWSFWVVYIDIKNEQSCQWITYDTLYETALSEGIDHALKLIK